MSKEQQLWAQSGLCVDYWLTIVAPDELTLCWIFNQINEQNKSVYLSFITVSVVNNLCVFFLFY